MKPGPWTHVDKWRMQPAGMQSMVGSTYGVFRIPFARTGVSLHVIATDGDHRAAGLPAEYAWEHVSVSLPGRTPNWPEMDFIKDLFWRADETVMQLHVPKSEHKNLHAYCLHLWRPVNAIIPRPPNDTVAP
jgi:hypothetical protein